MASLTTEKYHRDIRGKSVAIKPVLHEVKTIRKNSENIRQVFSQHLDIFNHFTSAYTRTETSGEGSMNYKVL